MSDAVLESAGTVQVQRSTALLISRLRSFEVHFQALDHPLERWQSI